MPPPVAKQLQPHEYIVNDPVDDGGLKAGQPIGFTGQLIIWPTKTAPAGWLLCQGQAISRTTYSDLFALLVPKIGDFTITIASPGVVTLTAHGLEDGDAVYLRTTGALPTGLSANTIYYVTGSTTNTLKLSATRGGSAINTSGSQSGSHSLYSCPWGLGDGSTTFNIPDMRANTPAGYKSGDTNFGNVGKTLGEAAHTLTTSEMPAHTHTIWNFVGGPPGSGWNWAGSGSTLASNSGSAGGGGSHNNIQPSAVVNFIIKH